ncbi:hypothetical protein HZS_7744 [Henneguya salminicola]|nr:hypothetical protein HZS_7744 [Henneguya salminicola]
MEAEIIPNFKEIDNVENGNESLTSSNYYLNHIDRVKLVNVFEVVEKGNLEEIKNLGDTFGWIIFNQSDEKGLGVLHHCCKNFDISVFIFILTHSQCSKSNELIYDVMQNKSSSLKFDPCLRTKSEDKSAPIHVACKYGNTQLVELLLNIGISLELTDARGKTPLLVASYSQKIETVIYLVSAGANIFAEDIELDTCLHWAAYKGAAKYYN